MGRSSYLVAVGLAVGFSSLPAAAAPIFTSRSSSEALVANCPSGPLGNVCDSTYVLGSGNFAGYAGAEDFKPIQYGSNAQSYAILKPSPDSLSHGSAIAFSVPDAETGFPVLKVGAYTRPTELGRYTTSYSFMTTYTAFTYSGTEPLPLSLVANIDFEVGFAPINYQAPFAAGSFPYSFGQLRSRILIGTEDLFQGVPLTAAAVQCGAPGVLATAGAVRGVGGFASGWGGTTQSLSMTLDMSQSCAGGGPVMLQPGQNFYLYAFLEAAALQGAKVDATNSLRFGFAPGTPASVIQSFAANVNAVGVPEPASWAMLIAGFGLVGVMARRRRAAAVVVGD